MSNRRTVTLDRAEDEFRFGFDSVVVERWRPVLTDQLERLQAARTPDDFIAVHLDLLARFADRQAASVTRRRRINSVRAEIAGLAKTTPRPVSRLRELNERINQFEWAEFCDQVLQHVARCITDALVWRLLDGDRRALTVLGDARLVGRLADGAGREAELSELARYAAGGMVAVHNDITNCLRYADLTIFDGVPPTTVGLREIKAGAFTPASGAQYDRLTHKLDVLRNHRDLQARDGVGADLLWLPVPYRTHLEALASLLASARADGHATEEVADGVIVSAVHWPGVGDPVALGDWRSEDAIKAWGAVPADRRIQGSSFIRRITDRLAVHRTYQAIAPAALLPIPADDVVDLLLGRLEFSVTVRFDEIENEFASRGITARCAGPDEWDAQFLLARRGDVTVTVPPHIGPQLTQELMTADTLVDVVEFLIEAVARGVTTESHHMLFCDERGAWPGLVGAHD